MTIKIEPKYTENLFKLDITKIETFLEIGNMEVSYMVSGPTPLATGESGILVNTKTVPLTPGIAALIQELETLLAAEINAQEGGAFTSALLPPT